MMIEQQSTQLHHATEEHIRAPLFARYIIGDDMPNGGRSIIGRVEPMESLNPFRTRMSIEQVNHSL